MDRNTFHLTSSGGFMKNLRLAMKLTIGFGVVLALTALLAVISWSGMVSP